VEDSAVAAFRLRRRGILWSLLAVFLVGLGLMLNAWLPPQPRCVIPTDVPMNKVDFISDDAAIVVTSWAPWKLELKNWHLLRAQSRQGPFQCWDTHSGRNLGSFEANPLAGKKSLEWSVIDYSQPPPGLDCFESIGYKETTKDGAIYSVREWVEQGPGFLQKLLGNWWPWDAAPRAWKVTVYETASGRILGQLQGRYGNGHLSNDGRTMVTAYREQDGSYSLRCWDLPLRPPLRLVVGIPLGIGLFFVLVSWWRRRRQAARLKTSPSTG
jgi:hypothetical protein